MKRKIFVAAVAVLFLVSCRRDTLLGSADASDSIGFSPYMERVSTKAEVTDVTASNLTSFKVMSYLQDTSIAYFSSEVTATKQESGLYTTDNTYYWPTSYGLDFFAYSGSGAGSVRNTKGVASLTYTVPDTGVEDFVVAKAENCTKATATDMAGMKAQLLTFSHALSKVNSVTLKAKQDGVGSTSKYKFIITDVSIKGAKNSATYMFNPATGGNWGPGGGSADYAFTASNFTAENGYFLGSASKTLKCDGGTNDQFIILPQTATFSITYSVQYFSDGIWIEVMDSTTKAVDIPMGMGKAYDISFVLPIDTSPIAFTLSSVDSWIAETLPLEYWEGGTNYGPGIIAMGAIWAPVNCGIGKDSTYPYGLLYQFCRSDGQPYDGETGTPDIVSGQTSSPEAGKFYKGKYVNKVWRWYNGTEEFTEWPMRSPSDGIGNPCPEGWRVPTVDELGSLIVEDWDFTSHTGSKLRGYIGDGGLYVDGVYFPACGLRGNTGKVSGRDSNGEYASSSLLYSENKHVNVWSGVRFQTNNGVWGTGYQESAGVSIRCVQK